MPFQQSVRIPQTAFFVGNIVKDGPKRSNAKILNSGDPLNNVIGRGFTYVAASDTEVAAGGTGVFAGVLVGPHQYASFGGGGTPLDPTLVLNNGKNADILYMGIISTVVGVNPDNVTGASLIGDQVVYDNATGELSSIAVAAVVPVGFTIIPNAQITGFNIPVAGEAEITLLGGQPYTLLGGQP